MSKDVSNRPRAFTDLALDVMTWQQSEFKGESFKKSEAEGKEEIKNTFMRREGFEDNPAKLVRVIDFIASGMDVEDESRLYGALSEVRQGSVVVPLPPKERISPILRLRRILSGEMDAIIKKTNVGKMGQVYTMALFFYINLSHDPVDEQTELLAKIIRDFDDPLTSRYEYEIDGLRAHPFLARLCAVALERLGAWSRIRELFEGLPEHSHSYRSLDAVRRKLS